MELKIDPNVRSGNTLGSLSLSGSEQKKVFEHLAYVFNVNEAKDSYTDTTLSDVLKTQIAGLSKQIENSQNVANMMNIAQSTLSQVVDTLTAVKSSQTARPDEVGSGEILNAALIHISDAKESISSFVANIIAPAINTHSVAIENLRASDSGIADFNFAGRAADITREKILSQSDISISAQAKHTHQTVLRLLAG